METPPKSPEKSSLVVIGGFVLAAFAGHFIETPFDKAKRSDEDLIKTVNTVAERVSTLEKDKASNEVKWSIVFKSLDKIERIQEEILNESRKKK